MATDILHVDIRVGDLVTVTGWGWEVRLADVGKVVTVMGFTPAGNIRHDSTHVANGHAIKPGCVAVRRRDGKIGHEGNRKCTCGALYHRGCLCNISLVQFLSDPSKQGT